MTWLSTLAGDTIPISSAVARAMPMPEKWESPVQVSDARAVRIRSLMQTDAAVQGGWETLLSEYALTDAATGPIDPFYIPNVYNFPAENAEAIVKVRYDGIRALNFALRWAIEGDAAAAAAACGHLEVWSHISSFNAPAGSDTRLSWSYTWPMFIAAAMLVADSPSYTTTLDADLKDVTYRGRMMSTAYTNPSNQGAWGVVLELAMGVFLDDRARFGRALNQWRSMLDHYFTLTITTQHSWCNRVLGIFPPTDPEELELWVEPTFGADCACPCHHELHVPTEEVHRQSGGQGDGRTGLFYSNFMGMALAVGAEWARFNGVWLYDYEAPGGSTLRGFWERLSGWTRDPLTFPFNTSGTNLTPPLEIAGHFEILQSLWPNVGAGWLLANRTVADRYGLRYLTLTHHGQPLSG